MTHPAELARRLTNVLCSYEGCGNPADTRGWCTKHYTAWLRHGDPGINRKSSPPVDRFWSYVRKGPSCWEWTGAGRASGYGRFAVNGKLVQAHRFSYELLVGPIPDGLQLDHLCRNRWCVNPSHLEPVTCRENLLRGIRTNWQTAKTHCPKGHPYDEVNTRWSNGHRICRACSREESRARRRRARFARESQAAHSR